VGPWPAAGPADAALAPRLSTMPVAMTVAAAWRLRRRILRDGFMNYLH
jgi:hypothetical protein